MGAGVKRKNLKITRKISRARSKWLHTSVKRSACLIRGTMSLSAKSKQNECGLSLLTCFPSLKCLCHTVCLLGSRLSTSAPSLSFYIFRLTGRDLTQTSSDSLSRRASLLKLSPPEPSPRVHDSAVTMSANCSLTTCCFEEKCTRYTQCITAGLCSKPHYPTVERIHNRLRLT